MPHCRLSVTAMIVLCASLTTLPAGAAPARAATRYIPAAVYLNALAVSSIDPRTLYVSGGHTQNLDGIGQYLARSDDAGATWTDLSGPAGRYFRYVGEATSYYTTIDAPIVASDGKHLYAGASNSGPSPASSSRSLIASSDRGNTWHFSDGNAQNDCGDPQYGAGPTTFYASPADGGRVYTVVRCGQSFSLYYVESSGDSGITWRHPAKGPDLLGPRLEEDQPGVAVSAIGTIVPDPTLARTVYVNMSGHDGDFVVRSDDAGLTWTTLLTPTAIPPVTSFTISSDPNVPGRLEAHATDGAHPDDQIFLSADHGATWRTARCPGDLHGTCPTITLANVFGAGHNYALFPDGVHGFDDLGPSGPRLALSDRLPLPARKIAALAGGTHLGDPIYLLGNFESGPGCTVYRSTDAGISWQQLCKAMLPTSAPPTFTPGSLRLPGALYPIAAPFVATYRTLGVAVLGLPLTGAYHEGTTLMQDFEHMRLEMRRGKVIIAHLGIISQSIEVYSNGGCSSCVKLVPSTLTLRFFPNSLVKGDSGNTLTGDFLRFWEAHGGQAVFGRPINQPFKALNGDGSKRKYTMQLFENARLELHPENRNPVYRVELGLLGNQYLVDIGWLVAK